MKFNREKIASKQKKLDLHPFLTLNYIQSIQDLRLFMETHVYAVWDFMSLLKELQHNIVPSGGTWTPTKGNRSELARVINEIVLCEESDVMPGGGHISHFDMYIMGMKEIGANINHINIFTDNVRNGFDPTQVCPNQIAEKFITTTFDIIKRGPHCSAAAFAFGRETVLPNVFTKVLHQLNLNNIDAPMFHYYLNRHIEVDGDEHGPMSLNLVDYFIDNDPIKLMEAEQAALDAIQARIEFFDSLERLLR